MSYQPRTMEGSAAQTEERDISGWAIGFMVFAGLMMIIGGAFQFFQGLAAVIEDEFYVLGRNYAFHMDVSTWGWIHMVVGIVVGLSGVFLFTGNRLARFVAILAAVLSAITNFLFIPYYPVWSLLIIAVDIGVIWALIAHGHDLSVE